MENKIIEKTRYHNIDLLKVIAIIMVISLHSGLLRTDFIQLKSMASLIEYAIRLTFEGVPIFIMVNGFLLLNKQKFDFKNHLKKL